MLIYFCLTFPFEEIYELVESRRKTGVNFYPGMSNALSWGRKESPVGCLPTNWTWKFSIRTSCWEENVRRSLLGEMNNPGNSKAMILICLVLYHCRLNSTQQREPRTDYTISSIKELVNGLSRFAGVRKTDQRARNFEEQSGLIWQFGLFAEMGN